MMTAQRVEGGGGALEQRYTYNVILTLCWNDIIHFCDVVLCIKLISHVAGLKLENILLWNYYV